jgi:parallel beta-helix repeat protein
MHVTCVSEVNNKVHNLNTHFNYSTIQEAINADETLDGHKIYVENGIYHENVVINKRIFLVGENKSETIVDANGGIVLFLQSNNSKITGFTIQNGHYGVLMSPWTYGHEVCGNIITNNEYGISGHYDVERVSICNNIISSNNITGIYMLFSNSKIVGNMISNNGKGEFQPYSSGIQISAGINAHYVYCINNTIIKNNIMNHRVGIWSVKYSEDLIFLYNNFRNNTKQISASPIAWNNTVMENYWDNYVGIDTDQDGIGEAPYNIDDVIIDTRPLMGIFHSFNTSLGLHIDLISNSTVEIFKYNESDKTITMHIFNVDSLQTSFFCRIAIPHDIISPPFTVLINDNQISFTTINENETLSTIYFSSKQSSSKILIVPELSSITFLLLSALSLLTVKKIFLRDEQDTL